MERSHIDVRFAYEYGDKSLPKIKELVCEKPDSQKKIIPEYLREHCVICWPGTERDIINPDEIIGYGNIYSDGLYYRTDVFINYVDKYNVPVPAEFRKRIMSNYESRRKRHMLLRMVNRLEIYNEAAYDKRYRVCIHRNGLIEYRDLFQSNDDILFRINKETAGHIINPAASELFCYDSDNHGKALIDGYHWKLTFMQNERIIDIIEGTNGEDNRRYNQIKSVIEFAKRFIPYDLGSAYMCIN
jgi:PAS domain-containing protein